VAIVSHSEPAGPPGAVIVTGAAQGIGAAVAGHLVSAGHRVVLADIQREKLRSVAERLGAEAVEVDIADPASVEAMVTRVLSLTTRIYSLVNVAGIDAPDAGWEDIDEQHWRRLIDVDLSGQWWCMKSVLPHMIAAGGGRIVAISSVCGVVPCAGVSVAYGAAKAGVIGLTMSLAKQVEKHGVMINAVAPGATGNTGTPMTIERRRQYDEKFPLGPIGTDPVARAVAYLLGDGGDFVSGTVLNVSGGYWHGR
jgi:NAD(P)-dependent dehydrogenase (short-subunit alcohol dehydrogenase family)